MVKVDYLITETTNAIMSPKNYSTAPNGTMMEKSGTQWNEFLIWFITLLFLPNTIMTFSWHLSQHRAGGGQGKKIVDREKK